MKVHKHKIYKYAPDYPGGGKIPISASFEVNLCDNMALQKVSTNDDEVTCDECLKIMGKRKK